MYLTRGQIVHHTVRGDCVFVGESGVFPRLLKETVPVVSCSDGTPELFEAFISFLKDESEETKPAPLVITGQGSFKISIEEGDL